MAIQYINIGLIVVLANISSPYDVWRRSVNVILPCGVLRTLDVHNEQIKTIIQIQTYTDLSKANTPILAPFLGRKLPLVTTYHQSIVHHTNTWLWRDITRPTLFLGIIWPDPHYSRELYNPYTILRFTGFMNRTLLFTRFI